MKALWIGLVLIALALSVRTNEYNPLSFRGENKLFIITLDGLRWQEVFNGADSALLNNPRFTADPDGLKALYWSADPEERRKKLMPFFWNVISRSGELYGNRTYGNHMNVANPYALSYPGYNELLTGSVDLTIFNNGKAPNRNVTMLEVLNATPLYKNKVAAFASWDAFPFILNRSKSKVYINSGFDELEGKNLTATEVLINTLQSEIEDQKNTRYDELTYLACREHIQKNKPSIVFLSMGGTDEAAHQKKYDAYLQQTNNADRMIGELWQYLQTLPEYAGKTTFLITTDHGRGADEDNWFTHGLTVGGSSQIWMGMIGNTVPAQGERKTRQQLYLKDVRNLALKILSHN